MTTAEFLQQLSDKNIKIWKKDDQLHFRASRGTMTTELKRELSERKADIVAELRRSESSYTSQLLGDITDKEHRHKPFPLTDIQSAYLIGRDREFELGNIACHAYFELEGQELDINRLMVALNLLIQRHEALRLVFSEEGTQKILREVDKYSIETLDLRGTEELEVEKRRSTLRRKLSHKMHAIGSWPMFDIGAIYMEGNFCLYVSFDLLVADFHSSFIMFRDLIQLYNEPEVSLEPIEFSFRDYVLAEKDNEKSGAYTRARRYWMDRITTFPASPQLPLIKQPDAISSPVFSRQKTIISRANWQKLTARCAKSQLTPSVVLLTAYAEVLRKWSSNSHFAINLTLFNRQPIHSQIMNVAGDFTVVSLLEVASKNGCTFEEKARTIQQQLWKDMDHRQFSGVSFIRELAKMRGSEGKALMPVVFSSMIGAEQSNERETTLHDIGRLGIVKYSITQTPQVYLDQQVIEYRGALVCIWDAVEELFPERLLAEMFEAYKELLFDLTNDGETWTKPSCDLISTVSVEPFEVDGPSVLDRPVSSKMLHTLFEEQAYVQPESEAVVTTTARLNYGELKKYSDNIASLLLQEGAIPNTLVAVIMEKGWQQIAAVLGILKSGAAYLPINPALPAERLKYILADAKVALVLTQSQLKENIDWPDSVQIFDVDSLPVIRPASPLPAAIQQPDDLAYVIYTSGSTGTPKGVMIDHIGAVNTILAINRKFQIQSHDSIFAHAALDFDLSVYDIFGILAAGARIVIPDQQAVNDPAHWLDLMSRTDITIWNSVPQVMQMLTEYLVDRAGTSLHPMRLILLSGDWIPLKLPDTAKKLFPNAHICSLGGATEASIWSVYYPISDIDPTWISIPYGKALANQKLYVFDDELRLCPEWVTGSLFIGGIGLAKGYWHDDEKTNSSFFEHPITGERVYRTGDLARLLPDGNLEFQGREDYQVKIRGYRIELGEIEATITKHPEINDAVVTITADHNEENRLMAYVVAELSSGSLLAKNRQADPEGVENIWQALKGVHREPLTKERRDIILQFHRYIEKISLEIIFSILCDISRLGDGFPLSLKEIMQQGNIHRRFGHLVKQWLDQLTAEGVLTRDGSKTHETYAIQVREPTVSQPEILPREFQAIPELARGIDFLHFYLQRLRKHSTNLLQNKISSLDFFFSEESQISPEKLSQLMPGTDLLINHAKNILTELIETKCSEPPMQILELGARTGETAAVLISGLVDDKAVYTCSDPSPYFLQKIEDRFVNYPIVVPADFDIEQDLSSQGYSLHSFDVIVASNSIHRSKNIDKALKKIVDLLVPGGLLILLEGTLNNNFQKISVGFIEEGFAYLTDGRAKNNMPMLSTAEWQEALERAGFARSFSPIAIEAEIFGQDLLVAQASSSTIQFDSLHLIDFLQTKLPRHMMPFDYIAIDAIPLSTNGKIDRKALPVTSKPQRKTVDSDVEAKTEVELAVATIWADILRLDKVSVNGNFFDLGGDSLLGTRIITTIRGHFGLDVSLRILFESPTVRELAQRILRLSAQRGEKETENSLPQITAELDNCYEPYPLSDVQQAYLIGRSGVYELGRVAAHCYFEFDGVGLDLDRANAAWQRLIDHHSVLRTIIDEDGQQQQILATVPFYKIIVSDLTDIPSQESEAALLKIRATMSHQIISIDQWPLFDIKATRYGENRIRVHVSFDNLILDGWSMFRLLNEWSNLYKSPETVLPAIDLSFRDYILKVAELKETSFYRDAKAYWLGCLKDLPSAPNLPLQHNPKRGERYRFSRFETRLDEATWARLKGRGKKMGLTASGLLLAAYAEVLGKWCDSYRFTLNMTTFNRFPLHPDVNEIVGDFTSLTLLKVDNSIVTSFVQRAQNLQKQLWRDLDHPYFSGIETMRELSRLTKDQRGATMPIVFTSALGLEQADEDAIGGNSLGEFIYGVSQTPQVLLDHQVLESSGKLVVIWDAVKELFQKEVLDDMFQAYCDLLNRLSSDDDVWAEKSPLMIPRKQLRKRTERNSTQAAVSTEMLHTLFTKQFLQQPEQIAVISSRRTLNYRELAYRAHHIGHLLRENGSEPNALVAVVMEKGWEQIVAVLGILNSGAAYLPIDPSLPKERLNYLIENGEVNVILTQSWLEQVVEWPEDILLFSVDKMEIEERDRAPLAPLQQATDLAYVIFTSGSTGLPKGVMINHRSVVNTILDVNNRFEVSADDRVLAQLCGVTLTF